MNFLHSFIIYCRTLNAANLLERAVKLTCYSEVFCSLTPPCVYLRLRFFLSLSRKYNFVLIRRAGQGFGTEQYEGSLMRTSSCAPSVLILEILRGSAVCISGRSACGVEICIVMRKSARRNQVKTSFVLHSGRPWLSLGFSSWDHILVTVVEGKTTSKGSIQVYKHPRDSLKM